MPKFYVTYGCGYKQGNCYSVIEAEDYEEAREIASREIGNKFAFMYDEKGFEGQPEKYGLTRIPLQMQESYYED